MHELVTDVGVRGGLLGLPGAAQGASHAIREMHGFWAGRELSILGVCASPAAPNKHYKMWGKSKNKVYLNAKLGISASGRRTGLTEPVLCLYLGRVPATIPARLEKRKHR